MRILFCLMMVVGLSSCKESKKEAVAVQEEIVVPAPYDTVAIDSFSVGAGPNILAPKVKIDSIKKDSVQ